jgi:3-hydroxyisobutyrate dehydrogenase-like beta-hydroxyacid dehydrogenase
MALAASAGAPAPMATTAQQLYRQVADAASVAAGGRPVDFSAIYKYVHSARPGV